MCFSSKHQEDAAETPVVEEDASLEEARLLLTFAETRLDAAHTGSQCRASRSPSVVAPKRCRSSSSLRAQDDPEPAGKRSRLTCRFSSGRQSACEAEEAPASCCSSQATEISELGGRNSEHEQACQHSSPIAPTQLQEDYVLPAPKPCRSPLKLRRAPLAVRILDSLAATHPHLLFTPEEVNALRAYANFREAWRQTCSDALVRLGPGATGTGAWQATLEGQKRLLDGYLVEHPEVGALLQRLQARRQAQQALLARMQGSRAHPASVLGATSPEARELRVVAVDGKPAGSWEAPPPPPARPSRSAPRRPACKSLWKSLLLKRTQQTGTTFLRHNLDLMKAELAGFNALGMC